MKKIIVLLIMLLLLVGLELIADNSKDWKKSGKAFNWNQAVNHCKSIGKRLPSRNEFLKAGDYFYPGSYWTRDQKNNQSAYVIYMTLISERDPDRGKSYVEKKSENYPKTVCH